MRFSYISLIVAAVAIPARTQNSFGWSGVNFLLNGNHFPIRAGQIDPQRVPYELWDERISFAAAMGLNTISSYLYWDQIEPVQGMYNTAGNNNISAWVETAQAHNLKVILRVGPYICGEHEWGGFPFWLSTISNMTVRSNNPQFLAAAQSYLQYLGSWLAPQFASHGGPILMAQVENEYGFYSNDHYYTQALADIMGAAFPTVTLYTNDGSGSASTAGSIPGVLAETDGGIDGFGNRDAYIPASSRGPYLDGEYYMSWLDNWGYNRSHSSDVLQTGSHGMFANIENDLTAVIKNYSSSTSSFSLYMFHGGTNWGFQNGADFQNGASAPVTTSYDYGAPLDESGRPNELYDIVRSTITGLVSGVPDVPSKAAMISTPQITMKPYLSMFDRLQSNPSFSNSPQNMEQLGQSTGYILYRYIANSSVSSGQLKVGDMPRDRVIVYVNNKRVGVIDGIYESPQVIKLGLSQNDQLDLLVENLGRVNFGGMIPDQRKGIIDDVYIGNTVLHGWNQFNIHCDYPPDAANSTAPTSISSSNSPIWYQGTFDLDDPEDTWLSLPGWTKGVAYINGVNLGRYWTIGPQQSLYMPGVYMGTTGNVLSILNLEPIGNEGPVQGISNRTWGNNADPDLP